MRSCDVVGVPLLRQGCRARRRRRRVRCSASSACVEQLLDLRLGQSPGPRIRMPVRNTSSCSRRPPRPTRTSRETAATHDCGRPSTTTAVTRCIGGVDAEQRAAQQSRGLLHQRRGRGGRARGRVRPCRGLVVEGDRPQHARARAGCRGPRSAGCQAAPRPGPRRPAASVSVVADLDQRGLRGEAQARCPRPAGRCAGVRCMSLLALGVGPRQLGEPAVELDAAGQRCG